MSTPNTMFSLPQAENPENERPIPVVNPGQEYFDAQFSGVTARFDMAQSNQFADSKEEFEQKFTDIEFESIVASELEQVHMIGEALISIRAAEIERILGGKIKNRGPMSRVVGMFKDLI